MAQSFASIVEAQIASGKTKLPVFEGTAAKLQEMLAAPPDTTEPLERLLSSDAVIASAVLRLANSSFYGGLAQVKTIRESLLRLGIDQVTRLALVVSQQQAYRVRSKDLQPVVSSLWRHALATGLGAQWLAGKVGQGVTPAEAFLAGMVHDIGKLLVVRVMDDLRVARPELKPAPALMDELLTSLHAKYGASLARQWNLPESYARVIEHHHDPEPADGDTLLILVRLVDLAANALGFGVGKKPATQIAGTHEAQVLRLDDIVLAELEVHVEDAMAAVKGTGW
jgi:putative nucleotidyltransferase with HDIG domain